MQLTVKAEISHGRKPQDLAIEQTCLSKVANGLAAAAWDDWRLRRASRYRPVCKETPVHDTRRLHKYLVPAPGLQELYRLASIHRSMRPFALEKDAAKLNSCFDLSQT